MINNQDADYAPGIAGTGAMQNSYELSGRLFSFAGLFPGVFMLLQN